MTSVHLFFIGCILSCPLIQSSVLSQEWSCYQQDNSDFLRSINENQYISYSEVFPMVTRSGLDSFSLLITVNDPTISKIFIDHPRLARHGSSILELTDDGLQGDAVPHDMTFTLDQITIPISGDYQFWWDRFLDCRFVFVDGREEVISEGLGLYYAVIDPDRVEVPEIERLDSNIQISSYVVNVAVDKERFNSFPKFATIDDRNLARVYYNHFEDNVDFIFQPRPIPKIDNRRGSYSGGTNASGVGDRAIRPDPMGSDVIGSIFTTGLDLGVDLLLHEVLHAWASFLDVELDLTSNDDHWGVIERPTSGFSAGGHAAFGVYESISFDGEQYLAKERAANTQVYNDLELYLMGLVPADSLFPIRTLVNPEYLERRNIDGEFYHIYSADSIRTVTRDEIISHSGVRLPTFPNTEREFSSSFIIPSHGRLLTEVEMSYYHFLIANFYDSRAFERSTQEKGVLRLVNTRRSEPLSLKTPFEWTWDQSYDYVNISQENAPIEFQVVPALDPDGQEIGWSYRWGMRPNGGTVFNQFGLTSVNNSIIDQKGIYDVLVSWGVELGDSILVEHGIGGCNASPSFCWAPIYRELTWMIRVDQSVSDINILSSNLRDIKVFPNPGNSDELKMQVGENTTIKSLNLFHVSGRKAWNQNFVGLTQKHGTYELNIPGIRRGIYFLRIHTNRGVRVMKILVQD